MNRRNFIKTLGIASATMCIIPALGVPLGSDGSMPVKEVPCRTDRVHLFHPYEIIEHWTYVSAPVFKDDGITYTTRLLKLKLKMGPEMMLAFANHRSGDRRTGKMLMYQQAAREAINRAGLKFVYGVYVNGIPIIDPYGEPYYTVFVSGTRNKRNTI